MCGIVGIIGEGDVVPEIYDGLVALQHRGQDAAGIMTFDEMFHIKKGEGLVLDVFDTESISHLRGSIGIGHVRYPTVGCGGIEDAQPFYVTSPHGIAMAHNGNVTNYHELRRELIASGHSLPSQCDVEVILLVFSDAFARTSVSMPLPDRIAEATAEVFRRVKGSYSVVAIVANIGLVAFRDPFGIKPLIMAERTLRSGERGYGFASESVPFDLLDYHSTRNLKAGEVVFIDLDRNVHARQAAPPNHHPCLFEFVYFARPDSFLDKVSVYKTRLRMGEALGREWLKTGIVPDVVIPVPESARPAATSMARVLGVPYREGLVKNRYIGRTFIMPGQKERQKSVRRKLNPIQVEFEGKDVLLVDDSIVRGTTCRQIIQIARQAGARKVYFASCAPELKFPCVYGIDMQTRSEFIARGRDNAEIAKLIGADALLYQPLHELVESARAGNTDIEHFCTACFSGDYPTKDVTTAMFDEIENERLAVKSSS